MLLNILFGCMLDIFFVGSIQHESLFPTVGLSEDRPSWAKIEHLSNSYADLGLRYMHDSVNAVRFTDIDASMRLELTQWPMPGYDAGFGGYGVGHLHVAAGFDWGRITVGDVYGQFGSGLILRLYEERSLGIDNALRGGKIELSPYKGINLTLLGGKQRRYWNMYNDKAWGFNYKQDATLGADMELHIEQLSEKMYGTGANLMIGGSYVSKYQADPEIPVYVLDTLGDIYRKQMPNWVGAGDVRTQFQMNGWNALVEYAYKANDPCQSNGYVYDPGQTLLASLSYSRKGLSLLVQAKHSENMYFRSDRSLGATNSGYLNHLPAFTNQHTYALASLYSYATQMDGEWAFQGELRYTFARKTPMGGKYGTTFRLNASHVRGLGEKRGWTMAKGKDGELYTDVNLELNKKITKQWYIGAMLMYQAYNMKIEGHEGIVRSGIGVLDVKYSVNNDVQMRAEAQYLYTREDVGQWMFLLYELSLYKQLMISAQYQYNIGHGAEVENDRHYYTVGATWSHRSHRLMLAYTKTREGYNCSGGVCRFVPKQEGVNFTYNYSF